MAASSELLDWLIAFRHPRDIWENHPSYLIGEIFFYFLCLLTLKHALSNGGRYIVLWFTTILHGLTVESISYLLPDIDNFWHGQTMVMLLGKRLPLHIMLFYPVLLYPANIAVSKLNLRRWAEPFAVGLAVVLLDVPFDIMGIKLLWWTWHDTDPNIYDRHYWVPWTSYYFHATFACAFSFLFHGTRSLISSTEKFQRANFFVELLCSLVTGLFSMPFGVLQFIPLYHPLHDMFGIHTEVCVLIILGLYAMIVWSSDRQPSSEARSNNKGWFDELGLFVVLHYILYVILVFIEKPEKVRSIGLHEKVGDCKATSPVQTAFGQVLTKKTFLCATDYNEGYMDWHCLKGGKPPADGTDWYTVCGTPFPNHIEYIVVVTAFSLLGLFIYIQMLAYSGRFPKTATAVKPAPPQKAGSHKGYRGGRSKKVD